jgi:hypothetical protein
VCPLYFTFEIADVLITDCEIVIRMHGACKLGTGLRQLYYTGTVLLQTKRSSFIENALVGSVS